MTYENPTPLRIGATGTLNGWRVRVAGRVVMGMEQDGETYTWNEFNLVDGSGNSATLVFEEGEAGPEWKLFREFTPAQPMTAQEAASKRVGDKVNLDGSPIEITLVDQSRVCRIEGQAPEGVDFGDVANYFNADAGERMLVASWTGDEIQFYEGLDVPADGVADAFGFPRGSSSKVANFASAASQSFTGSAVGGSGIVTKIVFAVMGVIALFSARSCFSGFSFKGASTASPIRRVAPPSVIANGAQGSIGPQHYVVTGQSLMEIARVSGRHERREYWLRGDGDDRALLVNGLSGGAKEWHLLRPIAVPVGLTPYDAAALRRNTAFKTGERTLALTDVFRSKILTIDPADESGDAIRPSALEYGFVAGGSASQGITIARWTEQRIQLLAGSTIQEADVLAAFGRAPVKNK